MTHLEILILLVRSSLAVCCLEVFTVKVRNRHRVLDICAYKFNKSLDSSVVLGNFPGVHCPECRSPARTETVIISFEIIKQSYRGTPTWEREKQSTKDPNTHQIKARRVFESVLNYFFECSSWPAVQVEHVCTGKRNVLLRSGFYYPQYDNSSKGGKYFFRAEEKIIYVEWLQTWWLENICSSKKFNITWWFIL